MSVTDNEIYDWINDYDAADAGPPATNSPIGSDTIGTDLDDQFRNIKSIVRKESLNKSWERWRGLYGTLTQLSATQFKVSGAGDQTGIFVVGRRIKAVDSSTLYGRITASSYSAPDTTVTVALDSGSLSGSLTEVMLGGIAQSQATRTIQVGHTYTISGSIAVPSGDTDFICPFFVPVLSGTTVTLKRARHIINSGTSVTCKLQKNGADLSGYTGISVTTTAASTTADATLADNDKLALVVTAVAGSPKNLSFTLVFEIASTA